MIPFRVFDRDNKQMWHVINYHPDQNGGNYLVALEDDSGSDGDMKLVTTKDLANFKFVDFLDESEDYND